MAQEAGSNKPWVLSADDVADAPAIPDGPPVVLAHPRAACRADGIRALVDRVAAEGADLGFGRVSLPGGEPCAAPARVEDLRHRGSLATAAVVLTRPLLRAVLASGEPSRDDPFRHWRLVRSAVAAGLVLPTDVEVAAVPPDLARDGDGPVPVDLAGPGVEASPADDLVLVYGEIDASVSLYFDGLPPRVGRRIRFLRPSAALHDLPHLLAAALVVVVRSFEHLTENGTLDLMDAMGVPYAWFVDDHVLKLAEDQEGFAYYSPERVARFAARACGVMASTPALAEAMAAAGRPVVVWPCVFDETLARAPPSRDGGPLAIGVVGGSFRRAGLEHEALPALREVDPERRAKIYGRFDLVRGLGDGRLVATPAELSFRQFVHRWRGFGCDVLLHPRGEAANMPFKSPATLLVARYIGAVPIVAASEAAYAGLGEREGVAAAGPAPAAWAAQLRRVSDARHRRDLFERLDAWCRTAFDPAGASARAAAIDQWAVPATAAERDRRLRRALARLADPVPPDRPAAPASMALRARWFVLRQARELALRTGTLEQARRWRRRLR